jgi:hypothetical protein
MMSLLEMAQEALARLEKIETARDGIEESKALENLRNELNRLSLPFKQFSVNVKVLRTEGVGLSLPSETPIVIETVNNVATRFFESPKSTTLRQGRRWTGLINKLEGLATQVQDTQTKDWQTFFENNLFGGVSPEQRLATLALTPENKKALGHYTELFQKFIKYRAQIPKDADEFKDLRALSKQLEQIKFQENVPIDVRKFFEATSKGASLDLLTNEVINWLRNNNLLCNYVVRAKIN